MFWELTNVKKNCVIFLFLFLAPTGALEEGILCVRYFPQKNIEKEFYRA